MVLSQLWACNLKFFVLFMQNPLENIHDARSNEETKHLSRPFKRFLFHYFFFVSKNDLNKRDLAQVLTIFSDYLPCNGGKVELVQKKRHR